MAISLEVRTETIFLHGVDLVKRRVYFTDPVDSGSVEKAVKAIHLLSSLATRPITIWISSPGGDVDAAFHLYDAMQLNKVPIHTVGSGEICSAATLILAAGAVRAATPNAFSMIHDASLSEVNGNHDQVRAQVSAFKRQRDLMFKLLERHSKLTADDWKKKTKAKSEVWLNTDQMYEYGIVDGVLTPQIKRTSAKNQNK